MRRGRTESDRQRGAEGGEEGRRGGEEGGSHCNLIWGGALSITSRAGPREEEAGML